MGIHFHCNNAKDREVQAKFEIIIDPPIDEEYQDYDIKEHRLLVDNDNKPVRLRNLMNGTKYQIIVASVNSVGVTYSEPESAYPSKEPPSPILTKVKGGNREIIVHFKCDHYDGPDIKAWFEMELDPPPPSIDQAGILQKINTKIDDNKEADEQINKGHYREKSRMRTKLRKKSRWRRQTISQKSFMGGLVAIKSTNKVTLNANEEKQSDSKQQTLDDVDNDDFVPYFRRNIRHFGSPVKISPVVNGVPYIVRVKAVTLSGSKMSQFSSAITPKGPPPIPKINKLIPGESSVQIEFVCNDYATEEYKAKFEIESFPQTVPMKNIKASPYSFPKLNNGRSYKFHLRGINKEGKSKWSEVSSPVTPLKIPPQPIELRCVPYDREITVFWVCEELKTPEYSGWYEVESEPPTFTMVVTRQQARFRRLDNGRKYTFKVTAVNQVGKATSDVSNACIPDDEVSKESYLRKKKAIACEVKEILLKIRKQQKKDKTRQKLVKLKKTQNKQNKREKEMGKKAYNKILAKEQINNLDSKFSTRNKGKNMNTASAMMLGKRKRANATKQKKKKKSPAANGGGGTPLIPLL